MDEASVPTSRATLATVRLLYSSVVIGVRRPCRNPPVTQPRFEAADKAAESRLLVRLHGQKFQSELLAAWPPHSRYLYLQRWFTIRKVEENRQLSPLL